MFGRATITLGIGPHSSFVTEWHSDNGTAELVRMKQAK